MKIRGQMRSREVPQRREGKVAGDRTRGKAVRGEVTGLARACGRALPGWDPDGDDGRRTRRGARAGWGGHMPRPLGIHRPRSLAGGSPGS